MDCFFTVQSYRLWSGRMSLLMAYFCEYMVDLSTPHGIWRRLCTSSSAEAVLRRLASSRAYSQAGVLPSCIGIPQPHVRVLVFKTILGSHIYDRLTSLRHIRGTSDDSLSVIVIHGVRYLVPSCSIVLWSTIPAISA